MAQGLEETGSRPCTWALPKKLVQELDQLTGIKEHQAAGEDFWLCDSAITQFQDPSLGCVQCLIPARTDGWSQPGMAQPTPVLLWGGGRMVSPAQTGFVVGILVQGFSMETEGIGRVPS